MKTIMNSNLSNKKESSSETNFLELNVTHDDGAETVIKNKEVNSDDNEEVNCEDADEVQYFDVEMNASDQKSTIIGTYRNKIITKDKIQATHQMLV